MPVISSRVPSSPPSKTLNTKSISPSKRETSQSSTSLRVASPAPSRPASGKPISPPATSPRDSVSSSPRSPSASPRSPSAARSPSTTRKTIPDSPKPGSTKILQAKVFNFNEVYDESAENLDTDGSSKRLSPRSPTTVARGTPRASVNDQLEIATQHKIAAKERLEAKLAEKKRAHEELKARERAIQEEKAAEKSRIAATVKAREAARKNTLSVNSKSRKQTVEEQWLAKAAKSKLEDQLKVAKAREDRLQVIYHVQEEKDRERSQSLIKEQEDLRLKKFEEEEKRILEEQAKLELEEQALQQEVDIIEQVKIKLESLANQTEKEVDDYYIDDIVSNEELNEKYVEEVKDAVNIPEEGDSEEDRKEERQRELLEEQRREEERQEQTRREQQILESQLRQQQLEQQRIETQRLEQLRLDQQRIQRQRENEEKLERKRLDQERIEKEKYEREKLEKERLERERIERERIFEEQERSRVLKEKRQQEDARREDELRASFSRAPTEGDKLAFFRACGQGEIEILRATMAAKDIAIDDWSDDNGSTPIILASACGHTPVVKYFVEELGADVEVRDNDGWTSMNVACLNGHRDTVQYLLSHGADIESKNRWGAPPLLSAAYNGHDSVVDFLLHMGASIEAKDNDSWTALSVACKMCHPEVVDLLVERGADLHAKNRRGQTPLMIARSKDNEEILQILNGKIAEHAHIEAEKLRKQTEKKLAAEKTQVEEKRKLDSQSSSRKPDANDPAKFINAVKNENISALRSLLEQKDCDIDNWVDPVNEFNSLITAALNGSTEILKLLLEYKASPKYIIRGGSRSGCTALLIAALAGHAEAVKILLDAGADPHHTLNGISGIMLASKGDSQPKKKSDHCEVIRLLHAAGVDVNVQNSIDRRSSLHYAVIYGYEHPQILKTLLEHGADPDLEDSEGKTAYTLIKETKGHFWEMRALSKILKDNTKKGGKGSKFALF